MKNLIILWRSILAALPRSESTPGLVESSGMIPLEEMWVSPMPLYPYCQNSPEPKWVPSFLLLLHIIKWFLEEDLIGCFLAKCSVGHLSMFSVLQASADRPSESMADICLAFFLLLLSVNNELQSHCGSCLGTLKSDNDRAGSTINQSDCESLCFVHFSGSGNLSYCQNCSLHGFNLNRLRDVDHLWRISR